MKALTFLILFILSPVFISGEEVAKLKLRAGRHPGFVRVVLEGPETFIFKGVVSQSGQDISVSFQDFRFSVEDVNLPFAYKIVKGSLVFSPGGFKGFKTALLNSPPRLVIDVYQIEDAKKAGDKIKPLRTKTVIVDPGHGGHEYGIIADTFREKDVVFDVAKRLRALIVKSPTRCFLTRGGDQFISLRERANFSNTKNGEIFLSLHIGKHGDIVIYTPVITGSEIRTEPDDSVQGALMLKTPLLRDAMQKAIKEDLGEDMVSIKPLPYSILSKVRAVALMIELPSFEDIDYTEEFKTAIAHTIYKGLYLYEKSTTN